MAKGKTRYTRRAVGTSADSEPLRAALSGIGCQWNDKRTGKSFTWYFDDVNEIHLAKVCAYGLAKLGEDRTSDPKIGDKLDAREDLAVFLSADLWKRPSAAGGGFKVPTHVQAIANVMGAKSVENARKWYKSLSKEEQAEVLAREDIQAEMAKLESEQDVDFDDLLS
jgi:hypothetical protein